MVTGEGGMDGVVMVSILLCDLRTDGWIMFYRKYFLQPYF